MKQLLMYLRQAATNVIQAIGKARALWLVRCLEIELHDKIEAADFCRDDNERIDNHLARRVLSCELVHARMRLAEFTKPGERRTWRVA